MQTAMPTEKIRSLIKKELPRLFEKDEAFRKYVFKITKGKYAEREKTEDRIDRILRELKTEREENNRRWEESKAESDRKWQEQNKKWEENNRKWEEQNKKTWEMIADIKSLGKRIDSSIGALGARWGLYSEASFRNGLKAILEEPFNVKVEHYKDYDEEGIVFGRPEEVELDLIIHNGSLILCEIKSSMSKSDMYVFWRKKEFYEGRHKRAAGRMIVISPMVDPKAEKAAKHLGIEVYSFAEDVKM